MSAEKGWGQTLLIGAGVVAIGGGLWYLYSSRETYSPSSDDEGSANDQQNSFQESKSDSEAERPPSKNSLPPLPERPTAAQRKARSNKQPKPSDQTASSEKPPTASKAEAAKSGDGASSSTQLLKTNDATNSDSGDDDPVLDWFQTSDEVIIMLLVSDKVGPEHIDYKLNPRCLEVKERGITLVQAKLPFPVQVEDSNWQFDEYQGMRVINVTLQKQAGEFGCEDWPHWNQQNGA